jgi:hypothetical protein
MRRGEGDEKGRNKKGEVEERDQKGEEGGGRSTRNFLRGFDVTGPSGGPRHVQLVS